MTDTYFRMEDYLESTGYCDVDGDFVPGKPNVKLRVLTYTVARKTPKGAWLIVDCERRFIADRWFKKYANPTLEGARADFIARKERLIAVQMRRIHHAQDAVNQARQWDKVTSRYLTRHSVVLP